jgi:extradiol dioxygenase family protein
MAMTLDHVILRVNAREESIRFYTEVLGLAYEGEREPFSVVRVTPEFTIQLAPWGTQGIEYGDSFHAVGNMKGPGDEDGARGPGKALYCFDPSKHLIEIRHYE